MIDLFYDGFRSKELLSRENPISGEQETEEEEKIRSLWTFVVSGLLDKQVRLYSFHASKAKQKPNYPTMNAANLCLCVLEGKALAELCITFVPHESM